MSDLVQIGVVAAGIVSLLRLVRPTAKTEPQLRRPQLVNESTAELGYGNSGSTQQPPMRRAYRDDPLKIA